MAYRDLDNRQRARIFVLGAILWAGVVIATGNDLFPWYWLLTALLLGFGVWYTLKAMDDAE